MLKSPESPLVCSGPFEALPLLSQCPLPDHWPEVVCPTDNLYWPKAASGKGADDLATFPRGHQLFIKGSKNSTDLSEEPA